MAALKPATLASRRLYSSSSSSSPSSASPSRVALAWKGSCWPSAPSSLRSYGLLRNSTPLPSSSMSILTQLLQMPEVAGREERRAGEGGGRKHKERKTGRSEGRGERRGGMWAEGRRRGR
eukprot:324171-Hanusia_phi.AAC.1